jgi:hypothetical protein
VTTIFDPEVDVYLDTVGDAASHADWAAVVLRAGATRRRRSAARVTVAMAVPAVGALGLLASGMVGGPGVTLAERAQAEVLAPPSATDGTVIHDTVRYRDATGTVFMSYDTWVAPDGTWCRRTREGAPGGTASSVGVPTAFTQCRLPNQTVELYIPADNAIYRVHAGRPRVACWFAWSTRVSPVNGLMSSGLTARQRWWSTATSCAVRTD